MDRRDGAARARAYIARIELPPPPVRRRNGRGAEPDLQTVKAVAVGPNLVEFGPGSAAGLRRAVADALLLAQLAADNAGGATPDLWYESYRTVLGHLGFRNEGLTRTAQDFSSADADLHEAILPVITAAFAGVGVPALVIETLRRLSEASADKPWITLFERESQRFDARQFQVSLVDGTETEQSVTLVGFAVDIGQAGTQVLFFRHAADSVAVERIEGRFTALADTLAELAPDVAAKLADRRQDYIAALEI